VLQLTRRDVEAGIRHLQGVHSDYLGIKGKTEDAFGAMASQCLSGVSAFGYGVAEGCYGPIKVGPVNADLLAALLIHGAAFFGYAGKHAPAAHSLAQGLADGFLGRMGIGVGTNLGMKRGHQPVVSSGPSFHIGGASAPQVSPQSRGKPELTDAEITALVERAR
jgi:hypothetical protein